MITCIICPAGCEMTVADGETLTVTGNQCVRGEIYAREEHVAPKRILTTTARIDGADAPLLPVRSDAPVPKARLLACVAEINRLRLQSPVSAGDVLISNILDTGCNIIASADG